MLQELTQLVIVVAVLAFIVYRQIVTRRVTHRDFIVPLVLIALGVQVTFQYLELHPASSLDLISFAAALAISIALAFPRAYSQRLWFADGIWWTKGTWATLLLWLATFASYFVVQIVMAVITPGHHANGFASTTIMLRIGISLGVQALVRLRRTVSLPARAVRAAV